MTDELFHSKIIELIKSSSLGDRLRIEILTNELEDMLDSAENAAYQRGKDSLTLSHA